jgi:hypothetical protein
MKKHLISIFAIAVIVTAAGWNVLQNQNKMMKFRRMWYFCDSCSCSILAKLFI